MLFNCFAFLKNAKTDHTCSFCIRILTLKKYGGIYLDNDILVINNFNRCELSYIAFL